MHDVVNYVVEPVAVLLIVGILAAVGRALSRHWHVADEQKVHNAVKAAIEPVEVRLNTRLDEQDDKMAEQDEKLAKMYNRLIRIETDQFGANHGGLREQVNKISSEQGKHGAILYGVVGRLESLFALLQAARFGVPPPQIPPLNIEGDDPP